MINNNQSFWNTSASELLNRLQTTITGLTTDEAGKRLTSYGENRLKPKKRSDAFTLLIARFKSPIILILLLATGLSLFLDSARLVFLHIYFYC